MTDRGKIIDYLLRDEQVYELATSIVERRTNPLELIGVVRIDDKTGKGKPTYEVWEGNRRVCAIMLLNDPQLASSKWRARFSALSDKIDIIETIEGRVFDDPEELRFWMRNIHNGTQGGQGRKDWGPDEQHRDKPTRKNAIAFSLLEIGEKRGLLTSAQRKGTLTTLQRFVGTAAGRALLGADDTDPATVTFTRKKSELNKIINVIMTDLIAGDISSRKNERDILNYFATLLDRAAITEAKAEDDDQSGGGAGASGGGYTGGGGAGATEGGDEDEDRYDDGSGDAEPPARSPTKIKRDRELAAAINQSGNAKLVSLYHSLTKVPAKTNPELIAVGCWALCETIANLCGAGDKVAFTHFFSKDRLAKWGVSDRASKTIRNCFERISHGGNDTKHDEIAATSDHRTLITDMERVSLTLAKALNEQSS